MSIRPCHPRIWICRRLKGRTDLVENPKPVRPVPSCVKKCVPASCPRWTRPFRPRMQRTVGLGWLTIGLGLEGWVVRLVGLGFWQLSSLQKKYVILIVIFQNFDDIVTSLHPPTREAQWWKSCTWTWVVRWSENHVPEFGAFIHLQVCQFVFPSVVPSNTPTSWHVPFSESNVKLVLVISNLVWHSGNVSVNISPTGVPPVPCVHCQTCPS